MPYQALPLFEIAFRSATMIRQHGSPVQKPAGCNTDDGREKPCSRTGVDMEHIELLSIKQYPEKSF